MLRVAQRVPGMREYLPEEEVIWDSSRIGTTPVSLRQCIAELLSWPPEHITIAKHFPEKFEWLVIKTLTGEQVIFFGNLSFIEHTCAYARWAHI